MIGASEHILSQDESILAASILDSKFNIVESASKEVFGKRFQITKMIQENSSAWATLMYGIARLTDETFGQTQCIVVHHDHAKLVLLKTSSELAVGLVLNSSANVDYLALKIRTVLNSEDALEQYI